MQRLTNKKIICTFKTNIIPRITGVTYENTRCTVKMDLFSKYTEHLIKTNFITKARAAKIETAFVTQLLK